MKAEYIDRKRNEERGREGAGRAWNQQVQNMLRRKMEDKANIHRREIG